MYFDQTTEAVFHTLKTTEHGLAREAVKQRFRQYGGNTLSRAGEQVSRLKIFLHQWTSPLIIILLVAGAVSGLLGERADMIIIFITAGVNGIIGFIQEDKANRALSKLRSLVTYEALVMRAGQKVQIPSEDIVPGDIVYLSAGDKIQADGRLIQAHDLQINEAALTGESEPVIKQTKPLKKDTVLAERTNMAYRGTIVLNGEGVILVTATGQETEVGRIATLVQETKEEETPLQQQLEKLSRSIGFIIILIASLIVVVGLTLAADRYGGLEIFSTAVAVAVAAIPEGLVISLTVILAVGMQRILRRRALVRKLIAAETLGSVSVICTDKTGTLTEGNMRLTQMITASSRCTLDECAQLEAANPGERDMLLALRIGVLCNDGTHENPEANPDQWKFYGDSTDVALLHVGALSGIRQPALYREVRRLHEIPFTSQRKYMATLVQESNATLLSVKGAPEIILQQAESYLQQGRAQTLTREVRQRFEQEQQALMERGWRVLALGCRSFPSEHQTIAESDIKQLTFVGLAAFADPLRPGVRETLKKAQQAGIHVAMITGDHPRTAGAIARELGLPTYYDGIITGPTLETVSDGELGAMVKKVSVFARVLPEHKIRIVRAFQANGEVVAMTGDGVNDAPALKGADIGIALGSGADIAKEVSNMVLLDNSFTTIVAAIEEGRRIYQNIKKVILYLLVGSLNEVVLITGSIIGGLPLAILPAQILWINIIEETLPTMALALDDGENENMADPPRRRDEPLFDGRMKFMLTSTIITSTTLLFSLFFYALTTTADLAYVRTLMFAAMATAPLLYVFAIRSFRRHIWQMNHLRNRYLLLAVLVGWLLLLGAVYSPPLQGLLRTKPLALSSWGLVLGLALLDVILIEAVKMGRPTRVVVGK